MKYMEQIGMRSKAASRSIGLLGQNRRNEALKQAAKELKKQAAFLLEENQKDIANAREKGMKESLIDRLMLTRERIAGIADGLLQIADLEDPIGIVTDMKVRPNGLRIGKKRVPLGVVGIIYESRPNVTADAFGLCLKSGNAVILRGGSDCIFSNKAIVSVLRKALNATQIEEDAVILIENTDRAVAQEVVRMNTYIDVLIPRGGAGLIQTVVKNSTVPVIETGTGNCHIYVDAFADLQMAVEIIDNAKTQRLGVCNACESLVIHEDVACQVVPMICDRLTQKGVAIRGDQTSMAIDERITTASDDDWGTEYLDKMISLKVVSSIDEAIAHINTYNTGHSESIITENYRNALKFQDEIDAAAVYVNASTRFTDGFEFGFGAEIGISTQKLHARGPMGLDALTTTKYIIFGDGQIR